MFQQGLVECVFRARSAFHRARLHGHAKNCGGLLGNVVPNGGHCGSGGTVVGEKEGLVRSQVVGPRITDAIGNHLRNPLVVRLVWIHQRRSQPDTERLPRCVSLQARELLWEVFLDGGTGAEKQGNDQKVILPGLTLVEKERAQGIRGPTFQRFQWYLVRVEQRDRMDRMPGGFR